MRYDVLVERRRSARVSIGVPTYNGAPRLDWLLQSLHTARTPLEDAALTILDDGSSRPGHLDILTGLSVRYCANLLHHHKNEGVTRSWNDLARFVDAEIVVLLNDDIVLAPHWLEHLLYFMQHNECGTVSPDIWSCAETDVPLLLSGAKTASPDPNEAPKICVAALGCAFGFRRSHFEAVYGFDERTRNTHNESWLGSDFALKLRLPSYILPDRVWHVGSATFRANQELHDSGDREAFIAHWGAYFEVTSPQCMRGMPPRVVRWLDAHEGVREQEFHMRWWD